MRGMVADGVVEVLRGGRVLVAVAARALAAHAEDISVPQLRALVLVRGRGQLRVTDIATELAIDSSTATRLVDRLARKGLLDRNGDELDRRVVNLRLTQEGPGCSRRWIGTDGRASPGCWNAWTTRTASTCGSASMRLPASLRRHPRSRRPPRAWLWAGTLRRAAACVAAEPYVSKRSRTGKEELDMGEVACKTRHEVLPAESLRDCFATLVRLVKATGAAVIFVGVLIALMLFLRALPQRSAHAFVPVRLSLGRFLALGLEFQFASDVLRTAIAPSFEELGKLAAVGGRRGLDVHVLDRVPRGPSPRWSATSARPAASRAWTRPVADGSRT